MTKPIYGAALALLLGMTYKGGGLAMQDVIAGRVDIVKKLNGAVVQAMKTPSVRDRLQGLGAQIVSDDRATPDYLAGFVKSEIAKWEAPIKASGVTVK
jgi:tripartite-type tricarboxylate transporter receptor subunit TctC